MTKPFLSPADLHLFFQADTEAGLIFWKERPLDWFASESAGRRWNTRWAGKQAFTNTDGEGYLRSRVWEREYSAHRVIWAMHYGEWPSDQIDHTNGTVDDNRLANLRLASNRDNGRNAKPKAGTSSPFKGVSACGRRWTARIKKNYQSIHLGVFATEAEAAAAYDSAAALHFGEFARLNFAAAIRDGEKG